jgi:hypothetical protein
MSRKRYTRNLGRELPSPLPVRTTTEWVRFEHEREPYGVFSYLPVANAALPVKARAELDALRQWFRDQLGAPDEATLERFWFRAEAAEHIEKARRLAELACEAGIPIVERRTRRVPGKVRWEDGHQVAVITYRDAPRPRRSLE